MRNDGEAVGLQQNDFGGEIVQRDADGLTEIAVRWIADEADAALANALHRARRGVQNAAFVGVNGNAFLERGVGADAERKETDPHTKNRAREKVDERVGGLKVNDAETLVREWPFRDN